MKINSRVLRAAPLVAYAVAAAVTVLQALAFALAYEAPKENYFASGSPLPILATVLAVIGVIGGAALFFFIPKESLTDATVPMPLASLLAAAGFAGGAIVLLLSDDSKLAIAAAVCLLLAAAFAATVAVAKKLDNAIKALLGFFAVIGCILTVALFYFDTTLEMNAPVKVTVMMGMLAVMLYYTAELRCLLGKGAPRLYRALSVAVLAVGALSSLPILLSAALGQLDASFARGDLPILAQKMTHPIYLAGSVIVLGTWLTVAIRFWFLMRADATASHDEAGASEQSATCDDDTPTDEERNEA